jgi:hypothetical protein
MMPEISPFSCVKHRADEADDEWQEMLEFKAEDVNPPGGTPSATPCPWCIDEMNNQIAETHKLLDTVGVPRRAGRKVDLPINERLIILFNRDDQNLSEMRTS